MTTDNAALQAVPVFSATLTPRRSLSRQAFLLLMAALSLVCFAAGVLFWAIGAWPVAGFFGLDVGLVWLAFRLNYRSAQAYEEVSVTPAEVLIRKVTAAGGVREVRFNPYWVRLDTEALPDEGVVRVALRSHGRSVEVGRFLSPGERGDLATALATALAKARAAPLG